MMQPLLGNVTTDDVTVTSLVYVNLTSLETYLSVMLELTLVCLPLCLSVCLSTSLFETCIRYLPHNVCCPYECT